MLKLKYFLFSLFHLNFSSNYSQNQIKIIKKNSLSLIEYIGDIKVKIKVSAQRKVQIETKKIKLDPEIDCLTKMQSDGRDISAQNLMLLDSSSNDSNNRTIFRLSSSESASSDTNNQRNDSKHLDSSDDLIGSKRQSLHENLFPNTPEIQESPPIATQKASSSLDISVKGILEEMSKSTDEVKVVMRRTTHLDRSSRLQRARSLGSIQTESTIKFNSKDATDEFIEIFDKTLVYIAAHKCSYWNSKNTVRKGYY